MALFFFFLPALSRQGSQARAAGSSSGVKPVVTNTGPELQGASPVAQVALTLLAPAEGPSSPSLALLRSNLGD